MGMAVGESLLLTFPNPSNYPETRVQSAGWTSTGAKPALPLSSQPASSRHTIWQLLSPVSLMSFQRACMHVICMCVCGCIYFIPQGFDTNGNILTHCSAFCFVNLVSLRLSHIKTSETFVLSNGCVWMGWNLSNQSPTDDI